MTKKSLKLKIIRKLKSWLTRRERKLDPIKVKENPNHFVDLTPKADLKRSKSYRSALKWALENEDIYNIALTGPYGSGKSSILKTFEQTNQEYKYLKISLASFRDDLDLEVQQQEAEDGNRRELGGTAGTTSESEDKPKPTRKNTEKERQERHRLIELSILQQIFYKETDEKLPQSRFKRIKKLNVRKLWKTPLLIIIWAAAFYYLNKKDVWKEITNWEHIKQFEAWILLFCIPIFIIGVFLILIEGSKLLFNAKFSKLNVIGGGVELNYSIERSILNKHLDEILYFFEETDYNVLIIEDLDRFNDPDIFTKLRELNLLINNSNQVGRPVRFIYAIKDDMFTDTNRTKFFDFIIPVLPVINYSNSLDPFLTKLEEVKLDTEIPRKFLYDITLYINDMRILLNIFNEFMLYKQNLNNDKLKLDKLLGMIVYKNMYPKDFSDLHNHEGIIYKVIKSKSKFIDHLSGEKKEKIEALELKIKKMQQEHEATINDLRASYIQAFIQLTEDEVTAIQTSRRVPLKDSVTDENFNEFKALGKIGYSFLNGSYEYKKKGTISFKELEKHVNDTSYDNRAELIESKQRGVLEQLQNQLSALTRQLHILKTRSFRRLLTENKSSINFFDDDFAENQLLVYLVRNGYIDEMYESFISYFYEKSLTSSDMEFLKHARNLEPQPFGYELNNLEELLYRLEAEDFIMEELLNFKLLNYLFEHESKHKSHLRHLMNQLANESKRSLDFTHEYVEFPVYFERYVAMLAGHWPGMWKYMVSSQRYGELKLKEILKVIITRVELNVMDALNRDKQLEQFIANSSDLFTYISEPEFESKILKVIEHFSISFTALDASQKSSSLFDTVYENWYYKINPQMIATIVECKGTDYSIQTKDLSEANYTSILKSGAEKLIEYVNDYLSYYVEEVLLVLPENTKESEDTVIALLKNPNLGDEQKVRVIRKQECRVTDIKSTDKGFWDTLLLENKLESTWANLNIYFNHFPEISEPLIVFLNNPEHYHALSRQQIGPVLGVSEEIVKSFALELIKNEGISSESFEALLDTIPYQYDGENIYASISIERVNLMIDKGNIPLSVFNLDELKKHYDGANIRLIEKYITLYLKNHDDYSLDVSDQKTIMMSSKITERNKLKIAELIKSEQLGESKALAREVVPRLVKNGHLQRPFSKLKTILSHGQLNGSLALLAMHIPDFTEEEGRTLLESLSGKFKEINNRRKNPTFSTIPLNESVLDALKTKGIIVDYRPYKGQLKVYHTIEKKPM